VAMHEWFAWICATAAVPGCELSGWEPAGGARE
jgi:hypothetical protein